MLDLTECLGDHSFDLRGRHVHKMTCAKRLLAGFDLKGIGTACARSLYDLEQIIMSGVIMLAPKLTHCVWQKWLTPPYKTQGFACRTQSYNTTLPKVYSRVSDHAQMASPTLAWGPFSEKCLLNVPWKCQNCQPLTVHRKNYHMYTT